MKSIINEFLIAWHAKRIAKSKTRESRVYHLERMVARIKSRDEMQIKRMEKRRGLV